MSEIEAATTDELYKELARRHSVLLVCGVSAAEDAGDDDVLLRFTGGMVAAIGLASIALGNLKAAQRKSVGPAEDI